MKVKQVNKSDFGLFLSMIDLLQKNTEIWDLFTRKEEYNSPLRDQSDRFPYYASTNRNVFEPLVSRYLIDQGYQIQYPDNKPFAVCLTHDIDGVYESILSKSLSAFRHIRHGNPHKVIHSIAQMRSKKLPLCNFSAIINIEEKYGAKSTFFFMAERPASRIIPIRSKTLSQRLVRSSIAGGKWGFTVGIRPISMRRR